MTLGKDPKEFLAGWSSEGGRISPKVPEVSRFLSVNCFQAGLHTGIVFNFTTYGPFASRQLPATPPSLRPAYKVAHFPAQIWPEAGMSKSPQLTPHSAPYFCLLLNCPKLRRVKNRSNMCSTIGTICGHCFRKKCVSDWKDIRDGTYSEERESSQDSEPSTQHLKSQLNRDVCVCARAHAHAVRDGKRCARRKVTGVGINTTNFPLSCSPWLCNSFWSGQRDGRLGLNQRASPRVIY